MIKNVLLTCDDGYNSLGIRVLAHLLRDDYRLQIVATKSQKTSVGGAMLLRGEIDWGEELVEEVPAFWVDANPADAIEFANSYFKTPFDLVISGINWGENIGVSLNSSGTFAGALRALGTKLAPRAIAISWEKPATEWFREHNAQESISGFLSYPGEATKQMLAVCLTNNFWAADMININLPSKPTTNYKITKVLPDLKQYFHYPIPINYDKYTFSYEGEIYAATKSKLTPDTDAGAIAQGFISITPLKIFI